MSLIWGSYRATVLPDFAQLCDDCVGPLASAWIVTSGIRSMAEQAALYAKGRDGNGDVLDPGAIVTNAKPGSSAHNYGLAIDVALATATGPSWDYGTPEWHELWDAVRASPSLHSGVDFPPNFVDPPHIERLRWRAYIPAPAPTET